MDITERHNGHDARQDKQSSGHDAAERAMHQPADIGGELLGFGTGEQHAVVQRMQEPLLRYPAFLLDQDAVHHRNLPCRAAEAQRRNPHPRPEGFIQRHAVGGPPDLALLHGPCNGITHSQAPGLALDQLCVSSLASRHQRYMAS
jgi:hypothetical protein